MNTIITQGHDLSLEVVDIPTHKSITLCQTVYPVGINIGRGNPIHNRLINVVSAMSMDDPQIWLPAVVEPLDGISVSGTDSLWYAQLMVAAASLAHSMDLKLIHGGVENNHPYPVGDAFTNLRRAYFNSFMNWVDGVDMHALPTFFHHLGWHGVTIHSYKTS
jgi:hypothetical protein